MSESPAPKRVPVQRCPTCEDLRAYPAYYDATFMLPGGESIDLLNIRAVVCVTCPQVLMAPDLVAAHGLGNAVCTFIIENDAALRRLALRLWA